MDSFIFGQQGAGKTTHALAMVNNFVKSQDFPFKVLTMCADDFNRKSDYYDLAIMINGEKPNVIVFDGLINTPADLDKATKAVQRYRNMVNGRYKVLGVYVVQGESADFISYRNGRS